MNYFGDQRFGSARHGRGFLAPLLVKGQFEEALKLAIATPGRMGTREQKAFKRAAQKLWGNWPALAARLANSPAARCPERRAIETLAGSDGKSPEAFRDAFARLPQSFQVLAVEAYQSHLWNAIARRLVTERCADAGLIEADDPFGQLLFPQPQGVPAELRGLNLPLLAPKTQPVPPWDATALAVLTEEGLTLEQLRIPGLRRPFFGEAPRPLFVATEDFILGPPEADPAAPGRWRRHVAFRLPRGAYATVVLRALGQ